MSRWILASSSRSEQERDSTAYLAELEPVVRERAEAYLHSHPDGEEVVLACLEGVGRAALVERQGRRALGTVKQDFTRLVTQVLVDLHGAGNVQTLRREDGRASTARNPQRGLTWVFSFMPHRVARTVPEIP